MMSGYVLIEAMLVIALIVSASAFSSTMLTAFKELEQNNKINLSQMMQKLRIKLEPVFAYVSENKSDIYLWIKNVGIDTLSYAEIEMSEIFITGRSKFAHLSHGNTRASWKYEIVREVFQTEGFHGEKL